MEALDNWADVVDSRNIVDRVNELQDQQMAHHEDQEDQDPDDRVPWSAVDPAAADELRELEELLAQLRDVGGDTPEDGMTLVRESYFQDYAQELADDIGATNPNAGWPLNCIDWEQAARELRMDYTSVEWGDVTYFVR